MSECDNVYGCIISESCSFQGRGALHIPKELCHLIGSFLRMSDEDRIKCMLANRDEPAVFVCCASVVDELDEIFELQYGYTMNDPWLQTTLTDRIVSLDSRVFRASLRLPYWGSMKTEYTLFALLRDMQDRGEWYSTSVFKWLDIFGSPSYAAIGEKIRSLWKPTPEEKLIESQDRAQDRAQQPVLCRIL